MFHFTNEVGQDLQSVLNARKAWADRALCPEVATITNMSASILTSCYFEVTIDGEVPKRAPSGADAEYYRIAKQALDRRFGSEEEHGVHIAMLSEQWDMTGDSNLIGYKVDGNGVPTVGRGIEMWEFVASDVLVRDPGNNNYQWTRSTGDVVTLPDAGVMATRIFVPHPRHKALATSWVINSHEICVTLGLYRMAQRATGRSQILADMILAPSEASPEDPTSSTEAWGSSSGQAEDYADLIEEVIHKAIQDAIKDANDGRQVLPLVMAVEADFIEKFDQLSIARKMDVEARPTVESLRKELAQNSNMPPEQLFGIGGTNRWNGKQVNEDGFRTYLEPKTKRMSVDIKKAAIWRELLANRVPLEVVKRFGCKVNNSGAIAQPDWATVAPNLRRDGTIGPSGARRLLGLDESYAPTEAEKAEAAAAQQKPPTEPANKGTGSGRQRDDTVSPDNQNPGQINRVAGSASPVPQIFDLAAVDASLAAATTFAPQEPPVDTARQQAQAEIARLSSIEGETMARLEEACEAAWDAGMARAGSQFKNWARPQKQLAARLPDEPRLVPEWLDHETALSLVGDRFASPIERDTSMFGPALVVLLAAWSRIVDRAWAQADLEVPPAERERARDESLAILRDSMVAALAARVFGGWTAPQGSPGRIPAPVIRRALAVAGGAPGIAAGFEPVAEAAYGMMFGPLGLSALGLSVKGWEWDYGPLSLRNSVAEFHHELDHQVFASTDDPALDGGPFGRRFPGDHFHCACRWSPVIG